MMVSVGLSLGPPKLKYYLPIISKTVAFFLIFLSHFLQAGPASAVEFELTEFFAVEVGYPGKTRDDFLTVGNIDIDGLLGIRPNLILSNHVSLQPSLGFGFPSVFGLFTSEKVVDIPAIVFVDCLYHLHFPGLYPYLAAGLGMWLHYLQAPRDSSATRALVPGTRWLFRTALNLGMGLSFLEGFKIGMTYSIEGLLGRTQSSHLLFDIDYALF
jgi:hypothetical protein